MFVRASSDRRRFTDIKLIIQELYDEDADRVKQALEEIGRVEKGDLDAMKAVQDFLRKERRMHLRIIAMQVLSKIKSKPQTLPGKFKKPNIFQCPGAEKIKRVEIIDVTCPHCHKKDTASVAGFENEFTCESCGEIIHRELTESCIEKCPVGSECVGPERYRKYMNGRKRGT